MAKKAYVGVNNIAKKVKAGYVGVKTEFPVYETQTETKTAAINSDGLLRTYFTVTSGGYGFSWSSSYNQFRSVNSGSSNSTSQITLTALQDCTVTYTYNYGTEANYDKFTLTVKGTTIHSNVSGVGTAKTRTDTLTKGQTIVFTYTKDGSVDTNGDYVAFYNMSVTITTTTEVQVGTTYKDVARKIKKAYVGVGGVARPCWGKGELAYYGPLEKLVSLSNRSGCATAEDKLLVVYAGVNGSSTMQSHFETYDTSLTKGYVSAMLYRADPASANIGKYAVFAGGSDNNTITDNFTFMDGNSAIFSTSGIYLTEPRTYVSGASLPSNAVFAGGSGNGYYHNTVEAIDADLTKTILASTLPSSCNQMKSAVLDDCAMFTYGYASNQPSGVIVKITDELTLSYLGTSECYTYRRYNHAAATAGNTVVIAGGYGSSISVISSAISCNKDFTLSVLSSLTSPARNLAGQSLDDYAMFAGGYANSYLNQFEYYDASLTKTVREEGLGSPRYNIMSSRIKDYAVFLGGYTGSNSVSARSVYAFTVQ